VVVARGELRDVKRLLRSAAHPAGAARRTAAARLADGVATAAARDTATVRLPDGAGTAAARGPDPIDLRPAAGADRKREQSDKSGPHPSR
jgi:hypothetical protein